MSLGVLIKFLVEIKLQPYLLLFCQVDPVVLVVASVWTTYVGVLQDKIGLVIGKGGDTIKSINQVS